MYCRNRTATCKINGNRSDGVPVVNWYKSVVEKIPNFFASCSMFAATWNTGRRRELVEW
jgi:hypothetical protein